MPSLPPCQKMGAAGASRSPGHTSHLLAYTLSQMVFGMVCAALGPTIPWLAERADVEPHALGILPAAQAAICALSGLASASTALIPREYHHRLLAAILLWLGLFFALLPVASTSLGALVPTFVAMVLPRPWISQITSLLVAELYEDPSNGSAAQSISKGGFALGSVVIVLLQQVSSSTYGTEATFYMGAGCMVLSALPFTVISRPQQRAGIWQAPGLHRPHCFTLNCCILYSLSMGLEASVAIWLITVMTGLGYDASMAAACNVAFFVLFAMGRLLLTPFICRYYRPRPAAIIVGGAIVALLSCIPAVISPTLGAIWVMVVGISLGAAPAQPLTVSMVKEHGELTNVDTAMLSISCTIGAGLGPFLMSRVLDIFTNGCFFHALAMWCSSLLVVPCLVDGCWCPSKTDTTASLPGSKGCVQTSQETPGISSPALQDRGAGPSKV